ncbi:MAG: PDZ domain-containing protein [Candidatus Sulfotelmatobacter sp.]
MRTHLWTIIPLLPLLVGVSFASQSWSVDSPGQPWVFSSEDGGTSSYLGVDIADVTGERLGALKLKEEKGVEVTMVDQDAPAGKAGIKEHDVILSMNGTAIESGAQLRRMIHETPPGRVITLGLSRDGQPMTVKVQLADKHNEFAFTGPGDIHVNIPEIHVPDIDIPSINMVVVTSSARSGLMVENITPQLGDFFGVKNGNGVLVRSVEKGSRAERAGFRAGDVIVKVNDQPVHDTSDFSHAVRSRNGSAVAVAVMRDKREQNLTLSLPTHKDSSDLYEEESFYGQPWAEAQSAFEVSTAQIQNEIAKLRPEMELAAENSRKAAEQAREELRREQKEFRKQSEQQREQMRKQREHLRRQLLKMRADWV